MKPKTRVLGYIKPDGCFKTIEEWEKIANDLISLQNEGFDTRGGKISCKHMKFCNRENATKFLSILAQNFGHLLYTEVERYDLLTEKNVLDFIEDFVNHRIWGLRKEFQSYFPNIDSLRFGYFYSRGDIEPYVLLDEQYTNQIYNSVWNAKVVNHYTTESGLKRILDSIKSGNAFDISTFTYMERPFFRADSNICITLLGNVRAGFRSDIKSFATESGRRACNLYRLGYPGKDVDNICYDLDNCEDGKTNLWNEFIATPIKVIQVTYKSVS